MIAALRPPAIVQQQMGKPVGQGALCLCGGTADGVSSGAASAVGRRSVASCTTAASAATRSVPSYTGSHEPSRRRSAAPSACAPGAGVGVGPYEGRPTGLCVGVGPY